MAFSVAKFRTDFVEYSDVTKFPDALLTNTASLTVHFMQSSGDMLTGDSYDYAVELLVAHMLSMAAAAQGGSQGGFYTSSTVDKVSVTMLPPVVRDNFAFYLTQTPYGIQLQALLLAKAIGGTFVGGNQESAAFRRSGGVFF